MVERTDHWFAIAIAVAAGYALGYFVAVQHCAPLAPWLR